MHLASTVHNQLEEGWLLASLIPNAQFVALGSKNYLLTEHEPAWAKFVAAFCSFLDSKDEQ